VEKKVVKIRVRDRCQAYNASGAGERASSTAGAEQAARRLAEKVFGRTRFRLVRVGTIDEKGPFDTIDRSVLFRAEEV